MNDTNNKNIVYCYNSKGSLKNIKTFDTLEECFNFCLNGCKNDKRKTTGNKSKIRKSTTDCLELF